MVFLWYHSGMSKTKQQDDVQITQIKIDGATRIKLAKLAEDDKRSMASEAAWLIEQEAARREAMAETPTA